MRDEMMALCVIDQGPTVNGKEDMNRAILFSPLNCKQPPKSRLGAAFARFIRFLLDAGT
jgi:hypothetical protein